MLEIIGAVLKILQMLLGQWFDFTDSQKQQVKEILKEVPDAKDVASVTRLFDRINRI